jgi:hypothetical protein
VRQTISTMTEHAMSHCILDSAHNPVAHSPSHFLSPPPISNTSHVILSRLPLLLAPRGHLPLVSLSRRVAQNSSYAGSTLGLLHCKSARSGVRWAATSRNVSFSRSSGSNQRASGSKAGILFSPRECCGESESALGCVGRGDLRVWKRGIGKERNDCVGMGRVGMWVGLSGQQASHMFFPFEIAVPALAAWSVVVCLMCTLRPWV